MSPGPWMMVARMGAPRMVVGGLGSSLVVPRRRGSLGAEQPADPVPDAQFRGGFVVEQDPVDHRRHTLLTGVIALISGILVTVLAVQLGSAPLYFAGTAVAGVGF